MKHTGRTQERTQQNKVIKEAQRETLQKQNHKCKQRGRMDEQRKRKKERLNDAKEGGKKYTKNDLRRETTNKHEYIHKDIQENKKDKARMTERQTNYADINN